MFVQFSHTFRALNENSLFPCLRNCSCGFLLHAKYVRNDDFGMFYSPILFLYISELTFPCFGDNTTDVKTIPIPFSLKNLCETVH